LAIAGYRISEIENHIAELRKLGGIRSEFHWSKYRGGERRLAYQGLISYAFDLINQKRAALHIIIADFSQFNHKVRVGNDRDTSVNRMYWPLCLHSVAKRYGAKRAIHIRFDCGRDSKDICSMRNQLCAAAYRSCEVLPNCVRSIEPVNSEKSGLIQMVDVIVGAIASKQNNPLSTSAKGELASFLLRSSGRNRWDANTSRNPKFLTV